MQGKTKNSPSVMLTPTTVANHFRPISEIHKPETNARHINSSKAMPHKTAAVMLRGVAAFQAVRTNESWRLMGLIFNVAHIDNKINKMHHDTVAVTAAALSFIFTYCNDVIGRAAKNVVIRSLPQASNFPNPMLTIPDRSNGQKMKAANPNNSDLTTTERSNKPCG